MASTNQPNGRSPFPRSPAPSANGGGLPSWNAAALLNPKAHAAAPARAQDQQRSSVQNANTANHMVFQFSSANGTPNSGYQSPATPTPEDDVDGSSQDAPAAGMSRMIERMNNIQDRSSFPLPKRRKIDENEDGSSTPNSFRSGGNGMLGEYVRQQRDQSQPVPSLRSAPSVDLTGADDGEDEDIVVLDKSMEEVCYGMIEGSTVNCHQVPAPKPGMKSLGGPSWWPQVKVVLRRKTGDPTTTIQVYDHTRAIFGHVDAATSSGIAQLLDSHQIGLRTDCIIPTRRRFPDEEIGKPISRAYKVQLMLYGKYKFARTVGRYLANAGLNLLSPPRVEKGISVFNPLAKENRVPSSTKQSNGNGSSSGPSFEPSSSTTIRTVEEIRSDVLNVFDSLTQSDHLPEAEADPRILTELLKHQKQALFFMTNREDPNASVSNSPDTPDPLWQRKLGRNGEMFFQNVITGHRARQPPPKMLGGLLADMMGLGKTLSVLSLITSTMSTANDWEQKEPIQPQVPSKKPSTSNRFVPPVAESLGLTRLRRNGKATLLVCPLSTVTNWEEQIKQHIQPGTLKYHIYHGPNRIRDSSKLAEFDLVVTTYGSVSSELNARSKGKAGSHPLEEISWFRIVLDEAHMIREQSTLQFKSICRLQASRRWAVTGTPVQNKLEDLAALLAFLRVKPFDDRSFFTTHIVQAFKSCDPEIVPKLRILVDTITLRRLKNKINLPERKDVIVKLKFSDEEQRLYDLFAKYAQERVAVLTNRRERMVGGKTYIHILQAILRLRLICAHGKELLNEDDLQVLQGMTQESAIDLDSDEDEQKPALPEKKAYDMFDLMKETNADVCIECTRKLGSNDGADIESERQEDVLGYMTPCFHLFCPTHIRSFRDEATGATYNSKSYGHCPFCQEQVKFACVELRSTRAAEEHDLHTKAKTSKAGAKSIESYGGPHTKTKELVQALLKNKADSEENPELPPFKSVVFSGWTSHLDLIQVALDSAGITYTRLDGKMSRNARTQAMDNFREDPSVQVILVSITAGGLGLNLTTANSVYVMEPQYNPAAEAQAIDRVHRLGQKRPVTTVRYIMQDSFEEKMLELQDKKIKLASLSMDGNREGRETMTRVDAAKQRLMDLRSLFK